MDDKSSGGKRGGGRKPSRAKDATVALSVTIPERLADALDILAADRGWSRSEAVARAVRQLIRSSRA